MGLISDKYTAQTRLANDDVRGDEPEWMRYFRDGRPAPEWIARRDAVREILASGGRSSVQGALAWNLARSPGTIQIPGCRTVAQVEENAGALPYGPLEPAQMVHRAAKPGVHRSGHGPGYCASGRGYTILNLQNPPARGPRGPRRVTLHLADGSQPAGAQASVPAGRAAGLRARCCSAGMTSGASITRN
jgi:Aldo/keto reductase family